MKDLELVDEVHKRFLRLSQAMRREAESLPVTTAQGAVLSLLRGGPMTIGDLARAEGIRPPSMTQIINRMEQLGWLARLDGPGKGHPVQLSEIGRRIAGEVRDERNARLIRRFAELSSEDRASLEAVLPVLDRLFGTPLPD